MHPVTGTYELACVVDTDDLVGTVSVELELAGETADQWLIVTGSAAGRGLGVISYFTEAGQVGKVKVTHADGADVAFDAVMWLSITDRGDVETVVCLELAFSDAFSSGAARDGWTDAVGSIWLNGGPDGSHAWDASTLGDELVYTADAADQGTRWVVRFDYYTETYPSGTSDHVLMGTSGSETQVKTEIGTSGQVLLYANGLRDTSAAGVVQLATWQTWEIDATLDAAGEGSIKLTIDGVVIYEQTGITTAAGPFLNAQFTNAGGTGAEGYDNIEIFVDRCVG